MYTSYYGLQLKPFENTPDPRFLFPSKSHREVLASLRYGVDNFKGFILITGGIGTGKTTMIYTLLRGIDSSYVIFKIVNPIWKFTEIIRYLAQKLRISIENKNNLQILEDLHKRLAKLDYNGKRVVLIIDEAHLLAESILEKIRLLSNLERENKKLIQIVLVGQDEIYQSLKKDSLKTLKQRIMINRRLEPLSKKETEDYINHRLLIAGRTSPLFSKNALSLLWRRSQGVPRLINSICDNALLIGYASDAKLIRSKVIKEVIKDINSGFQISASKSSFRFGNFKIKWVGIGIAIAALSAMIVYGLIYRKYISSAGYEKPVEVAQLQPQPVVHRESISISTDDVEKKSASEDREFSESFNPSSDLWHNSNTGNHPVAKTEIHTIGHKSKAIEGDTSGIEIDQKVANVKPGSPSKKYYPIEKIGLIPRVVRPDDNLWKIAKEMYGNSNHTIVDYIHMANPNITTIDRIYAGQIIYLPDLKKENLICFDESGFYHIHYASFYEFEDASRCVAQLVEKNQKSVVIQSQQQENRVYRVYYGNFKSYEEAIKEINNLQLKYLDFLN